MASVRDLHIYSDVIQMLSIQGCVCHLQDLITFGLGLDCWILKSICVAELTIVAQSHVTVNFFVDLVYTTYWPWYVEK